MPTDLDAMLAWAEHHMATHVNDRGVVGPDFTVYQDGAPYLEHWYVIPRNDGWVPWQDFVEVVDGENAVGKGCG